jgi:hypothetical protein
MGARSDAQAQRSGQPGDELSGVGIGANVGVLVPSDIPFRTAEGETVTLATTLTG